MADKKERYKLNSFAPHPNPPHPSETLTNMPPFNTAMHHSPPAQENPTNATIFQQPDSREYIGHHNEGSGLDLEHDDSQAADDHHQHAPIAYQSETGHGVSFPEEDFKRNLNVIATDPDGSEHPIQAVGLFDSGSESKNIISGRLARKLKLVPEQLSRWSRFRGKIMSKLNARKRRMTQNIRGVDGSRLRGQQGSVFVEWQCLDSRPRTHQYLFFDPKTYRTKFDVVDMEDAAVDLIFSRRTWLEEKLTEPSVCALGLSRRISKKPKVTSDPQDVQQAKADREKAMKKRNDDMARRVKSRYQSTSGQPSSSSGGGGSSAAP